MVHSQVEMQQPHPGSPSPRLVRVTSLESKAEPGERLWKLRGKAMRSRDATQGIRVPRGGQKKKRLKTEETLLTESKVLIKSSSIKHLNPFWIPPYHFEAQRARRLHTEMFWNCILHQCSNNSFSRKNTKRRFFKDFLSNGTTCRWS